MSTTKEELEAFLVLSTNGKRSEEDEKKYFEAAIKLAPTIAQELIDSKDRVAELYDACLNADRYFKAKDGIYFCNVGLCETAAKYAVDRVLK